MKSISKLSTNQDSKVYINDLLTSYLDDSEYQLKMIREQKFIFQEMCESIVGPILNFSQEKTILLERYEANHLFFLNKVNFKRQIIQNNVFRNTPAEEIMEEEMHQKRKIEKESRELHFLFEELNRITNLLYNIKNDPKFQNLVMQMKPDEQENTSDNNIGIVEEINLEGSLNASPIEKQNSYAGSSNFKEIKSLIFTNKSNKTNEQIIISNNIENLRDDSKNYNVSTEKKTKAVARKRFYLRVYLGDSISKENKISCNFNKILSNNPLRLVITHFKRLEEEDKNSLCSFIKLNFKEYFFRIGVNITTVCGVPFNYNNLIKSIRQNREKFYSDDFVIFLHKEFISLLDHFTDECKKNCCLGNIPELMKQFPNEVKLKNIEENLQKSEEISAAIYIKNDEADMMNVEQECLITSYDVIDINRI